MSKTISVDPRLQSFFLECARRSFEELGLRDQTVVEYVARVLTSFAHSDHLYRLHTQNGRRLDSAVAILAAYPPTASVARQQVGKERERRKYVGDYTLFMSGLFRTYVEKSGSLDLYLREGQRSYWQVSELDLALYQTGFLLFQELSKNFEHYSGALDYMRKAYFAPLPGEDPFGQFLRQVQGWVKVSLSDN